MRYLSLLMVFLSLAASANTYNFTYDDPNTFMVTGTFQGTSEADGNTVAVSQFGDFRLTMFVQPGTPQEQTFAGVSFGNSMFDSTGLAVVTLDGSFMRFGGCLGPYWLTLVCEDGFLISSGGEFTHVSYGGYYAGGQFIAADWKLTDPPSVPEPATLGLLGLGLLGLVRRRA